MWIAVKNLDERFFNCPTFLIILHYITLQLFSQDYGLVSYTTHVVSAGTYILMSTTNDRFLKHFSRKSGKRNSPKKYFFIFRFWCLLQKFVHFFIHYFYLHKHMHMYVCMYIEFLKIKEKIHLKPI